MGNYYEGEIAIGLIRELPDNYIELFCAMSRNEPIPSGFLDTEYFKKDRWDCPNFTFGYWYINDESDNILIEYDDDQSEFANLVLKGYYINVSVCMKGYSNHMESLIEFVKPYIHSDTPNYLGKIKDEDGWYKKQFFADYTELKKEVESRIEVCEECNFFSHDYLCNNYELCSNAYHRGKEKSEKKSDWIPCSKSNARGYLSV